MKRVIVGEMHKIDFLTTLLETETLERAAQLNSSLGNRVCLLADIQENHKVDTFDDVELYVPYRYLDEINKKKEHVYIYFELECYSFFHKVKHVLRKKEKPKGVFRYRRTINSAICRSTIAEELFVFASIFGEPESVHVKESLQTAAVHHMIILINFGEGTMAHVEYTLSDQEKIEMEWSGIKQIIEFDNEEASPVRPHEHTALPLSYSVDSIVYSACKMDQALLDRLAKYKKMLDGGATQ